MSKTKSRSLDLAVQDKVCAYLGLGKPSHHISCYQIGSTEPSK